MASSIQIAISLIDNPIPPLEISERLHIKAETALLKGERNQNLGLPRHNLWAIRSDLGFDELGEHWRNLHEKFGVKWDDFVEIAKGGRSKITIIVKVDGRLPSVIVPPEMAGTAFEIGAPIDIDYYE